jgi:hypothetical protein
MREDAATRVIRPVLAVESLRSVVVRLATRGRAKGLIHDAADGPCASPALGAAAEAAVNLAGGPRGRFLAGERRPHVVVS